jgi:exonuclease III
MPPAESYVVSSTSPESIDFTHRFPRRSLKLGWTDALRHIYPDQRIYTYWDYLRRRRGAEFGLRIDHLLLSDVVLPRLRDAGVDTWVRDLPNASDHAPTWIELSPPKR